MEASTNANVNMDKRNIINNNITTLKIGTYSHETPAYVVLESYLVIA